jgi:hypothetical protein
MLKALMKKRLPEESRADLTTIALKKGTRDKLDSLGFDRHASYDLIINSLLQQRQDLLEASEISKKTQELVTQIVTQQENKVNELQTQVKKVVEQIRIIEDAIKNKVTQKK